MSSSSTTDALDKGDRALQEGIALVQCLQEACEGPGQFNMPHIATVLDVVRERLSRVRAALQDLAAAI